MAAAAAAAGQAEGPRPTPAAPVPIPAAPTHTRTSYLRATYPQPPIPLLHPTLQEPFVDFVGSDAVSRGVVTRGWFDLLRTLSLRALPTADGIAAVVRSGEAQRPGQRSALALLPRPHSPHPLLPPPQPPAPPPNPPPPPPPPAAVLLSVHDMTAALPLLDAMLTASTRPFPPAPGSPRPAPPPPYPPTCPACSLRRMPRCRRVTC